MPRPLRPQLEAHAAKLCGQYPHAPEMMNRKPKDWENLKSAKYQMSLHTARLLVRRTFKDPKTREAVTRLLMLQLEGKNPDLQRGALTLPDPRKQYAEGIKLAQKKDAILRGIGKKPITQLSNSLSAAECEIDLNRIIGEGTKRTKKNQPEHLMAHGLTEVGKAVDVYDGWPL